MEIISVFFSALALGSIYALMALAIGVVYSARRIVNFAQGDLTMLAGLVGVVIVSNLGMPYAVGLIGAAYVAAMVGILVERLAVRSLPRSEHSIAWILSILAVVMILTNASQLLFGTDPQRMPSLFSGEPLLFSGVRVLPDELLAIAATVAIAAGLHLLQDHTLYGKAMKAAARDPAMAAMLGIRVDRYIAAAFALSGVLAAIVAFLIGPITFVGPHLGFALGLNGFAAAALGGLGTFRGAIVGGFLLGTAEMFSSFYISSSLKESIALIALSLVLIFRPTGLLGEPRLVKM